MTVTSKNASSSDRGSTQSVYSRKIASDHNKPNGLFVILPENAEKFVESLKIEQFFGVGKVTAKKMHDNGIFTGYDLKQYSENSLVRLFGKMGHELYLNARGIDNRGVEPNRITKSISNETTFLQDKDNRILLTVELYHLAKEVFGRMREENFFGKTITVKVKYADFKMITRSKTLPYKIRDFRPMWTVAREMMKQIDLSGQPVRLIGFGVGNASDESGNKQVQLELNLF